MKGRMRSFRDSIFHDLIIPNCRKSARLRTGNAKVIPKIKAAKENKKRPCPMSKNEGIHTPITNTR